jgi:phage terminase large subunit-like protein
MNRLNRNLFDQVVVIKAEVFQEQFRAVPWRVWLVLGGYGASAHQLGRQLQCRSLLSGEEERFDGMAVERIATADDLAAVEAAR